MRPLGGVALARCWKKREVALCHVQPEATHRADVTQSGGRPCPQAEPGPWDQAHRWDVTDMQIYEHGAMHTARVTRGLILGGRWEQPALPDRTHHPLGPGCLCKAMSWGARRNPTKGLGGPRPGGRPCVWLLGSGCTRSRRGHYGQPACGISFSHLNALHKQAFCGNAPPPDSYLLLSF